MKTYLPVLLAGLWLSGSCSKPDVPSGPGGVARVPADYTILTASEGLLQAEYFHTDGIDLQPVSYPDRFVTDALPTLYYRDTGSVSFVRNDPACPTRAAWYDSEAGDYLERDVLAGLDPCQTEVLTLFHAGTVLYLGLQNTEKGDKPPAFLLRRVAMEGGTAADLPLPARPVDLARVGNRIFVLTLDAADTQLNTLQTITADSFELLHGLEIGFNGRTLLPLDQTRLLVSFPDKHVILDAQTLDVRQTVRYQQGLEPAFCGQAPLVSPDGNRLFYLYRAALPEGGEQQIPAQYELDRNTAVFYYFENFLSPVQREIEYDVSEASAIGFDARNQLLLVGYTRKLQPSGGGVFRLDIGPDFGLADHVALPARPLVVFTR